MAAKASINTDPFEFGVDGDRFIADADDFTIPSFGSFKAGDLRKVKNLDEVTQMFTLCEQVVDVETLAALDELSIPEIARFFEAWQNAARISLPN